MSEREIAELHWTDDIPVEVQLAYGKRARDYANMYGNGSAALRVGILRLTLEAWRSGSIATSTRQGSPK